MQRCNNGAPLGATNVASFPEQPFGHTIEIPAIRTFREIERLVAQLSASWHASSQLLQRRRWHRVQFERPLLITPLDSDDQPVDSQFVVVGRDISVGGISFAHRQPLVHQRVAVTFPLDDGATESVVTRLTWCRFTCRGIYLSGGQFVRATILPTVEACEWHELPPG